MARRTAPQPWFMVIALATVMAVAVGGYLLTRQGPARGATTATALAASEILTFEVGGAAAKCVRPVDPRHLREADLVFAGLVTGLADGLANVQVTRTFKGEPGDEVRLRQRGDFSEALSGGGDFEVGRDYLLTVSDGDVADCLSGAANDPSLQESYDAAF